MNPQDFIAKWRRNRGQESAGAQEWFIDLCRVVEHPTPAEMDRSQQWYTFERSVRESSGQLGRADVYKRGYFAWEFKGLHHDLDAAYRQLQRYREALNNPPLLVVSDFQTVRVHTNFTNKVSAVHAIPLDDLGEPESLEILRSVFHNPDALEPEVSPEQVTQKTADVLGRVAQSMRGRGIDSLEVAKFLNRLVFCFFAQDVGLLPARTLTRLYENFSHHPARFDDGLRDLFIQMNDGGRFGTEPIRYFNGDLFKEPDTVLMQPDEVEKLLEVINENWAHVDPSILGTLFERAVDPQKQGLIGAQYTSEDDIRAVIDPVVMRPLYLELADAENRARRVMLSGSAGSEETAAGILREFQSKVASLRVLDPACGSGNFLYVALRRLHDLEKEILTTAAHLGVRGLSMEVSPEQCYGIEIDDYASSLAYTALWIGHLQWSIENGYRYDQEPVLGRSNNVVCRDAIVDRSDPEQPIEPEWPAVDYIVGNPPFLGHVPFREQLGDEYANAVYSLYGDRIPNSSDLCCYWLEKARAQIADGKARRAGLLATQAIRFQSNRPALERIKETGDIFEVVSDKDWVLDGANVHISIVCFDDGSETTRALDGETVNNINADLTAGADLTQAKTLPENAGISFMGDTKVGAFDIPADVAEEMLRQPNPHGKPNSDVIKRWMIGRDINQVSRDMWIIDFGVDMSEDDAALYEAPFEYIVANVKPERLQNNRRRYAELWWIHAEARPGMRQALAGLPRYIGTSMVSRHRIFAWIDGEVLPDATIIVFARDDDYFFGILQSRAHTLWAETAGTQLREAQSGLRYTPTTCFEMFPFPVPTDELRQAIATAAHELNQLRENWLNPTDLFGNPALNADQLRRRTLTNLYNDYPTWLSHAHDRLDAAVAKAYGWPADLADGEILERLLALNLARAGTE